MMTQLYRRDDARRLAQTLLRNRRNQGEALPNIPTHHMRTLAANLVAAFAARPASLRTARLAAVTPSTIVLKIRGAY